ncbi:carbonic anhydrase family protein [Solibacillus sp. FSL W7-1436]|uniref:carbonic anhydrase n=1 Tax=Solibacillus sp. FSL W7-1436 TaxID=2921705 RepID=UPI0030F7E9AD
MKKLGYLFFAMFSSLMLAACAEQKSEEKEVVTTSANHSDWSYEESTGPEHWGELDPSNLTCVNGSEQSPINVEFPEVKADGNLKETEIHYESTPFTLENNGHTIQANATTESNHIIIEGNEYKLSQFHFHTPSEHQFNGQNYDMELHLVHSDEKGELAVIGLMIQEGNENKLLASMWNELPTEKNAKADSEKYDIDLQALLPEDETTFHYTGSLTTPPCTEEVQWIIYEQPIEMSKEQIEAFRLIFPDNHRPVQPINERDINKNGE